MVLFVTATLGTVLLGFWDDSERRRVDRRSVALAALHITAAAAAIVAWVVYLIGRSNDVGRVALAVVVSAVMLGVTTLTSTWRGDRGRRYVAAPDRVPSVVLLLHGAAAVVATALVALSLNE